MHFRSSSTKSSPRPASPASTLVSKQPITTVESVDSDQQAETEMYGVDCWDFAYPTGKCTLPANIKKNCCFSKQYAAMVLQSRFHHTDPVAPVSFGDNGNVLQHQTPSKQPKPTKESKSAKKNASAADDSKTYLLSSPTPCSILDPQTQLTISTLLSQPNTKLVYLVPQSNIVCPKVCELMRLPVAKGSSFRVLPIQPEIQMRCAVAAGGADQMVDQIAVREVVEKVFKNTKARSFDGYIAFEDEREAWLFLEQVGKGVEQHAAKKGLKS